MAVNGIGDQHEFFFGTDEAESVLGVTQENQLANIAKGGQLGVGINAPMLDVATPAVFVPTTIVVTSTPMMYGSDSPMTHIIKELMESHPKAVSGIEFQYQLGTASTPVGLDGQEMMVPTKTTRSAVNPSFVFQELSGNLVWNVMRKWIWDINNPDTNASQAQIDNPGAYIMSTYSMSMMAIQFDPTMRPDHIIDAAFYTNMFPTTTDMIGMERTIGTTKIVERTINFSAIVQHNPYIKSLAKAIAEQLRLHEANYELAPPNKKEVDSSLTGYGLNKAMEDVQDTWTDNTPDW